MEFTKFFSQLNKELGLFPALRHQQFAKMMNIVSLEVRIDTLRNVRSVKPEEVFMHCHRNELAYYQQLLTLHHNALPEYFFHSLILDSYPQPLEYYLKRSEIHTKILNFCNEGKSK